MKKYKIHILTMILVCALTVLSVYHGQLLPLVSICLGVLLCLLLQERQWYLENAKLRATHAERERIARVLHDSFLQSVEAVVLRVDVVAQRMHPGSKERQEIQQALDMAQLVMCEGRDQIRELRAEMTAADIDAALRQRVALFSTQRQLDIVIASTGEQAMAYSHIGREIYNIACEALANAVQHAQARRITVTLDWGIDAMQLLVVDDGVGMEGISLTRFGAGGKWGLRGMRERAVLINGQLSVGSRRQGGTEVHLVIPAKSATRQPAGSRWPARQPTPVHAGIVADEVEQYLAR